MHLKSLGTEHRPDLACLAPRKRVYRLNQLSHPGEAFSKSSWIEKFVVSQEGRDMLERSNAFTQYGNWPIFSTLCASPDFKIGATLVYFRSLVSSQWREST